MTTCRWCKDTITTAGEFDDHWCGEKTCTCFDERAVGKEHEPAPEATFPPPPDWRAESAVEPYTFGQGHTGIRCRFCLASDYSRPLVHADDCPRPIPDITVVLDRKAAEAAAICLEYFDEGDESDESSRARARRAIEAALDVVDLPRPV